MRLYKNKYSYSFHSKLKALLARQILFEKVVYLNHFRGEISVSWKRQIVRNLPKLVTKPINVNSKIPFFIRKRIKSDPLVFYRFGFWNIYMHRRVLIFSVTTNTRDVDKEKFSQFQLGYSKRFIKRFQIPYAKKYKIRVVLFCSAKGKAFKSISTV